MASARHPSVAAHRTARPRSTLAKSTPLFYLCRRLSGTRGGTSVGAVVSVETFTCRLPKSFSKTGRWASGVRAMDRNVPRTRSVGRPARGLRNHTDLALENLALRQQLALLGRRSKRPQFGRLVRAFWVWLSNRWAGWRQTLYLVRPETVIRWHRQGFRTFWTWKSRRGRVGRPRVGSALADLVRTMALANPLWGAPRIHGELLKLGLDVSQRTVARLMPRRPKPPS
jgi:hypothetical protein